MRSARCSLWRWNLNQSRLAECRPPCLDLGGCWGKITPGIRAALAKACATKATPWFKNVSAMERIGREIVGPVYRDCDEGFQEIVDGLFAWIDPEFDLLAIERGTITAPAGCGKTQLIADALARHNGPKPILGSPPDLFEIVH